MSLSGQTPQRPLPGAYVQTPAPTLNLRRKDHSISNASLSNSQPQHDSQNTGQAITTQTQQKTQEAGSQASETLGPVERAARTINEILTQETRYPELDNYVGRKRTETFITHVPTNRIKRGFLQTTRFHRSQHGRRFRKSKCMTYRTRYSINIIVLRSVR